MDTITVWTDGFQKMFVDWPVGTFEDIVMILCIIGFVGYVLRRVIILISSRFSSTIKSKGVLISKTFIPAHQDIVLLLNTAPKTSLPQFLARPDAWSVIVELNSKQARVSISKALFDLLSENDPIMATYTVGLFTNNIYIEELSLVQSALDG